MRTAAESIEIHVAYLTIHNTALPLGERLEALTKYIKLTK